MDNGKVYFGDEDEWAARWKLNTVPEPPPQQQPAFLPSFALVAAATRGDLADARLYIENKADVMHDDCKALRTAVINGHYDIAELILKAGAAADALDGAALVLAAEKNDARMTALLLAHKADVNRNDAVALRRAAALNNIDAVMELAKAGADLFATPYKPNTLALDCAEETDSAETAAFLETVMTRQKQNFIADLQASSNTALFMRAPYAKTGEPGLIRAVKMGCLDEALSKMKSSADSLLGGELTNLQDRQKRQLRYHAVTRGDLMKLFDPPLWNNKLSAMEKAWRELPSPWFESGIVRQDDFDTLVAEHGQKILKSKAHKYRI